MFPRSTAPAPGRLKTYGKRGTRLVASSTAASSFNSTFLDQPSVINTTFLTPNSLDDVSSTGSSEDEKENVKFGINPQTSTLRRPNPPKIAAENRSSITKEADVRKRWDESRWTVPEDDDRDKDYVEAVNGGSLVKSRNSVWEMPDVDNLKRPTKGTSRKLTDVESKTSEVEYQDRTMILAKARKERKAGTKPAVPATAKKPIAVRKIPKEPDNTSIGDIIDELFGAMDVSTRKKTPKGDENIKLRSMRDVPVRSQSGSMGDILGDLVGTMDKSSEPREKREEKKLATKDDKATRMAKKITRGHEAVSSYSLEPMEKHCEESNSPSIDRHHENLEIDVRQKSPSKERRDVPEEFIASASTRIVIHPEKQIPDSSPILSKCLGPQPVGGKEPLLVEPVMNSNQAGIAVTGDVLKKSPTETATCTFKKSRSKPYIEIEVRATKQPDSLEAPTEHPVISDGFNASEAPKQRTRNKGDRVDLDAGESAATKADLSLSKQLVQSKIIKHDDPAGNENVSDKILVELPNRSEMDDELSELCGRLEASKGEESRRTSFATVDTSQTAVGQHASIETSPTQRILESDEVGTLITVEIAEPGVPHDSSRKPICRRPTDDFGDFSRAHPPKSFESKPMEQIEEEGPRTFDVVAPEVNARRRRASRSGSNKAQKSFDRRRTQPRIGRNENRTTSLEPILDILDEMLESELKSAGGVDIAVVSASDNGVSGTSSSPRGVRNVLPPAISSESIGTHGMIRVGETSEETTMRPIAEIYEELLDELNREGDLRQQQLNRFVNDIPDASENARTKWQNETYGVPLAVEFRSSELPSSIVVEDAEVDANPNHNSHESTPSAVADQAPTVIEDDSNDERPAPRASHPFNDRRRRSTRAIVVSSDEDELNLIIPPAVAKTGDGRGTHQYVTSEHTSEQSPNGSVPEIRRRQTSRRITKTARTSAMVREVTRNRRATRRHVFVDSDDDDVAITRAITPINVEAVEFLDQASKQLSIDESDGLRENENAGEIPNLIGDESQGLEVLTLEINDDECVALSGDGLAPKTVSGVAFGGDADLVVEFETMCLTDRTEFNQDGSSTAQSTHKDAGIKNDRPLDLDTFTISSNEPQSNYIQPSTSDVTPQPCAEENEERIDMISVEIFQSVPKADASFDQHLQNMGEYFPEDPHRYPCKHRSLQGDPDLTDGFNVCLKMSSAIPFSVRRHESDSQQVEVIDRELFDTSNEKVMDAINEVAVDPSSLNVDEVHQEGLVLETLLSDWELTDKEEEDGATVCRLTIDLAEQTAIGMDHDELRNNLLASQSSALQAIGEKEVVNAYPNIADKEWTCTSENVIVPESKEDPQSLYRQVGVQPPDIEVAPAAEPEFVTPPTRPKRTAARTRVRPKKDPDLEDLMRVCMQPRIMTFRELIGLRNLENAVKIGEATYSEVYMLSGATLHLSTSGGLPNADLGVHPSFESVSSSDECDGDGEQDGEEGKDQIRARRKARLQHARRSRRKEMVTKAVLKIIPFDGRPEVNGFPQQRLRDVYQEIRISQALGLLSEREEVDPPEVPDLIDILAEEEKRDKGEIRMNAREVKLWWKSNFVKGLGFGVCRGPYPKILLDRWDQYASEKGTENDRPDYFDESQLFAVLILEHGGVDLEHSIDKLDSYGEIRSILQQCAVSLAIAEQRLRFEHRDLHWGNLLIKRPEVTSTQCVRSGEPTNEVVAMYRVPVDSGGSRMVRVSTHNIKVCLIDFTLSRLELDGQLFHVPMDDESFFTGEGDYQYDVYRSMRKHTRRRWKGYHPVTNVLWMDYLIDKLLSAPILVHRAKSTKKVPKPDRKKDNTAMLLSKAVTNPTKERAEIVSLHKRVRSGTYESVGDLVLNDPFFAGIFVG